MLQRSDDQDAKMFFSPEPQSAEEVLQALLHLAEHNAARPERTKMFNVLAGEAGEPGHPAHDYFLHRYRSILGKTAEGLRAAVTRGELKPDTDCEAAASEIAAVMDGLQLQRALAPETYDVTGKLYTHFDRLLRSLSSDASPASTRIAHSRPEWDFSVTRPAQGDPPLRIIRRNFLHFSATIEG
ncbi:TetR family transcriptional regulator C-terminal domain-containing protein [Streptomyces sp. NPDC003832]